MVTYWNNVSVYTPCGVRKYVSLSERTALSAEVSRLPTRRRLLVLMVMWTGARPSEVLAITPQACEIDASVVSIITLKRRKPVIREVPLPPDFMEELDREFGLRSRQRDKELCAAPLWHEHRVTLWRLIKAVMQRAGIEGVRATPRGLRHSFGVATLASGVPLPLVQRLLGHASLETTSIYTEVIGPEQQALTARFWGYVG